jgi:hypothetical protein
MNDPSPELVQRVQKSFAKQEPTRLFRGCKVTEHDGRVIVRIYSNDSRFPSLIPTPYQIFSFDGDSDSLSLLSGEEAAPFTIQNYK